MASIAETDREYKKNRQRYLEHADITYRDTHNNRRLTEFIDKKVDTMLKSKRRIRP